MTLKTRIRRSTPVVAMAQRTKSALRTYGTATSVSRCSPDFIIIGAKRGGTTSLYKYLLQHPGMLSTFPRPARVKGTYFFDEHFGRGTPWYFSHFPLKTTAALAERRLGFRPVCGEASPYYLFHPLAPMRCAAVVPDTRIIVLLRNPIERADSHFRERRVHQTETLETFYEALLAEPERLAGETERLIAEPGATSVAHRHLSYSAQSNYIEGLTRWFSAFDAEQILVERSEDLYERPQEVFNRVTQHIGLPAWTIPEPKVWNAQPKGELDTATVELLQERLGPGVEALQRFLNRDMHWHHFESLSSHARP